MGDVTTRRRLDGLVESCYAGRDATQLRVDALRRLRTLVSIDAAFFATVDPLTLLFTSAVSEEPLIEAAALFMDNEYGPADVNRFADLAASDDPVGSLDRATRGERRTSRRYTEIMAPLNLGDELRVVLRAGGRAWGVMCLHREDGAAGFSDSEVALLRNLAPTSQKVCVAPTSSTARALRRVSAARESSSLTATFGWCRSTRPPRTGSARSLKTTGRHRQSCRSWSTRQPPRSTVKRLPANGLTLCRR